MPAKQIKKGGLKAESRKAAKAAKVKPELPGGFRDYGPADAIIRQRLLEKVRKTFEDFGFDPLETPAVERTEVLTGGERESAKIIFNIRGSKEKRSDSSLRFDLTVPLARFISANPDISKPFKRYQIGQVWRGESPQAGRYREFLQADADIVGSSSLGADAEIIALIYGVFINLGIQNFLIKINDRKLLDGLPVFAGFPASKLGDVLRTIDKKDKIGEAAVRKELTPLVKKKAADKIMDEFLKTGIPSSDSMKKLNALLELLDAMGVEKDKRMLDFSVVRGLGYYTGPVFEAMLTRLPQRGSVAGGGRYDTLTVAFTGEKLPSVGVSFGVDRLLAALDELGLLKKKPTVTKVLILNLLPEASKEYLALAKTLRAANINTAIYLGDDRAFQAQLAYAVKKEIPYVVMYGEDEKKKGVVRIKNLMTREQKEVSKEHILQYFKR